MTLYVVAVNQKEANELARDCPEVCFATRPEAERHLKYVKSPPTDPYYANQYRVYAARFSK